MKYKNCAGIIDVHISLFSLKQDVFQPDITAIC